MGAATHSEEVLVASHHPGLDVVWRVAGLCSEFGFSAVYLYDLLMKRPDYEGTYVSPSRIGVLGWRARV